MFQPQRLGKPFKGTIEEEGRRARDFIQRLEMVRTCTPNLTDTQLVVTATNNMQDAAEAWFFTEKSKFF